MKRIFLSLSFFIVFLKLITGSVEALAPKPITGTFLMLYFNPGPTPQSWYPYFDDVKEVGMDTVILLAMGGQYCGAPEWNYFTDGTMEGLLQAAYDKNIKMYLGLAAGQDGCAGPSTLIDLSVNYIDLVKHLNEQKGWGNWTDANHFIQGFYINQEIPIQDARISGWTSFYRDLSRRVKNENPSKKIMISPYKYENLLSPNGNIYNDTYQTIYDGIYYLGVNTDIDIIAPQDGVGTQKVITLGGNRIHFQALKDATNNVNRDTGKNIQAWANIEAFYCSGMRDGCSGNLYEAPTVFPILSWQIRSVDDLVVKKITWIHQWSLMKYDVSYLSSTRSQRIALRNEYLNKPIITAAFTWYTPINLVIKGYNFGLPGQQVRFYLHYRDFSDQLKNYSSVSTIYDIDEAVDEIRIPIEKISNFDISRQFELAVVNPAGFIGYYVSYNPESNLYPSFPEIAMTINNLRGFFSYFTTVFDYNNLVANYSR